MRYWAQLPVIVRAIISGALMATVGTVPWGMLARLNLEHERRHGPVIAILVTGLLFGLAHFTHPEVAIVLLPYYVAVAAVYGGLAYFTESIFPSMVLHGGGNMLGAIDLFARGQSEWQASSSPAPLIWKTGTDPSFWISLLAFLFAASAAVWAYAALAAVARAAKPALPAAE